MRAGAAALAGAVLVAPASSATKPRTVCHLVTDARGDAGVSALPDTSPVVPGTAADDLLGADVASDGRTVTVVLRLADLPVPDPAAPTGRAYVFSFQVRGTLTTYFLAARTYPTGTRYLYGYYAEDAVGAYAKALGEATGSVSSTAREVRVRVPAAALRPAAVRRGTTLVALYAGVYRWWGQGLVDDQGVAGGTVPLGGVGTTQDTAEGDRYVVGTPSCVKP